MEHPIREVEFVNEQEAADYDCTICLEKFIVPMDIHCGGGHLFCETCVYRLVEIAVAGLFRCPTCRGMCDSGNIHESVFVERKMMSLHVKCPNKRRVRRSKPIPKQRVRNENENKNNEEQSQSLDQSQPSGRSRSRSRSRERSKVSMEICNWTGPYNELQSHRQKCNLQLVQCRFCERKTIRSLLKSHFKNCPKVPINCPRCHIKKRRCQMDKHLKEFCLETHVRCSRCKEVMLRKKLHITHWGECPDIAVKCEYSAYGCTDVIKRKDLKTHLTDNVNDHLLLVTKQCSSLNNQCCRLERICAKMSSKIDKVMAWKEIDLADDGDW